MIHSGHWIKEDYPHIEALTPQEQKVFQCLIDHSGDYRKIETELVISKSTLKTHLINIFQKVNAHSKLEAVLIGLKTGLISIPNNINEPTQAEPICILL